MVISQIKLINLESLVVNKLTPFKILEEVIPQKQISESRLVEDMKFYSMLQKRIDERSTDQPNIFPIKSFDIVETLDKYSLMKEILWACEEQAIIRERLLNEAEIKDEAAIASLKKSRDLIFNKMEMINLHSSRHVKRRDFMPLLCNNYSGHTANAFFAEFSLWFLGDDFRELNSKRYQYKKLIFTEQEFNFLRKVYFSADTPDDFVHLVGKLVKADPSRVAVCRFESAYSGFIIAHKNDLALKHKLSLYSRDFPHSLSRLESELHDNILILNLMKNDILKTDIINNFDVWIDIDTLVVYARTDLFPISVNLDIRIRDYYNTDYAYFTFFDYSMKANKVEKTELQKLILKDNPYQNPREFYLYDGRDFTDNGETFIESHCNILLIQYTITEYVSRLIVFDIVNHVILNDIDFANYDKDAYIKLYNDTLSLLELNVIDN